MSIKTDAVVIRDETTTGANTATRVGTNLVDIADDLVAKQAAIDLNSAKETNIAHPLVETAVPVGAVFTDNDTIYDDTAIQAEVDLNTAKVGVTTEEANPDVVGQAEAEAGTATTERIWTAERVKQAIVALGGSGSVDDTAYGISWDGVTGTAPSKNALYDFIESQVFKVDATSNIIPIFWGGTQAQYDIDFPSGHTNEYFIVITDGAVSPTNASDIVNTPSGNLVATDVQGALDELQTELDTNISFDSVSSTRLANTSGTNTGDQVVTTGTGTSIDLTNVVGAYYNIGASSTATAFTVPTVAVGGFAVVQSASTTTEPTVTVTGGTATGIPSLSWTASTVMYLNIYSYDGTNVFYYWSDIVSGIEGFTASTISDASANAGLLGTEEVIINTSGVLEKTTTQDIANLGGGVNILEITNSAITFTELKSWTNATLDALTVDLTGAINGAKTVSIFNSVIDPQFNLIPNITSVSGSWVTGQNLLLEFNYFQNEVYLVIHQMSEVPFTFVPTELGVKLQMFLDLSDNTSVTIDGSNNTSAITDLSLNSNDFTSTVVAERPLKKQISISSDGVDDVMELSAVASTIENNQQGEVFFLCAPKELDTFKSVFALADNEVSNNSIYFGYDSFSFGQNRFFLRMRGSGLNIKMTELNTYQPYENLGFNLYSISTDGIQYKMYKNGVQLAVTFPDGANNGNWFGDLAGLDTISLSGLDSTSLTTSKTEIASVIYSNEVLTVAERSNVVRWVKNNYFGMDEPLNLTTQVLTPNINYQNTAYNWTGGVSKNPVNSSIVSLWDKGTSHYLTNDLHDIVGHKSIDGGDSYGAEFTVVSGGTNISYTNASIGYHSGGRLHCLYSKIDHTGGVQNSLGLFSKYSDDDGATWSTEVGVTGLGSFDLYYTNTKIVQSTDGNMYATMNESSSGGNVNLNMLRSTDNGVTWAVYSVIDSGVFATNPVNETSTSLIAPNTLLCIGRVQSRNFYKQYISTDNGLNWTHQGDSNFADWWTNETTGTSSLNVHLPRTSTFEIEGQKIVALIYLNRGVSATLGDPSYMRVVFAKAQDVIDYGIDGWQDASGVKINVDGIVLDNLDGYPDIEFLNNDNNAYIRMFYDYSVARTETSIMYFKYDFNIDWLKAILNI